MGLYIVFLTVKRKVKDVHSSLLKRGPCLSRKKRKVYTVSRNQHHFSAFNFPIKVVQLIVSQLVHFCDHLGKYLLFAIPA